ncbi:MAG: FUSC family protein, partial [Candidatus Acidiferrales bacterium]
MADMKKWTWLERGELVHAARTTVAAVASLLIARMLRMPDVYWAAIISMIVMQSALGAAWTISRQRLAGTAIGAAMGAVLATYAGRNAAVFGAGVFACGVICAVLGISRNSYRYAGITLAIVLLITRAEPPWMIAVHRFIEIS